MSTSASPAERVEFDPFSEVFFGDQRHASTAHDLAAYVLREMVSPEGAFYATQDADSEGEEGRFFVWTSAQVDETCAGDAEAARVAKRVWGSV